MCPQKNEFWPINRIFGHFKVINHFLTITLTNNNSFHIIYFTHAHCTCASMHRNTNGYVHWISGEVLSWKMVRNFIVWLTLNILGLSPLGPPGAPRGPRRIWGHWCWSRLVNTIQNSSVKSLYLKCFGISSQFYYTNR